MSSQPAAVALVQSCVWCPSFHGAVGLAVAATLPPLPLAFLGAAHLRQHSYAEGGGDQQQSADSYLEARLFRGVEE